MTRDADEGDAAPHPAAQHLRRQAEACTELGSPMYADLLTRCADDLLARGPVEEVLRGYERDPGPSALGLRLLGSVHRLVLDRRAGELATFYPSVGGSWDPETGWRAFRALLAERPDDVRACLVRAPQTNEVGRSAALMGGLLRIGESFRMPLRLHEIGASAGLNLLADRFAYEVDGHVVQGSPESPVRLRDAWRGRAVRPWPDLEVVERVGADVHPVDPTTTDGRLTLTSYVWPDHRERHERLRGALALAADAPVDVRAADAVSFVQGLGLARGAVTVLWHSVMWQYLDGDDQEAVTDRLEGLGASADHDRPLAHLYAEPTRRTPGAEHTFLVVLRSWPGGGRRVLGTTAPHGLPTTWE